MKEVAILLLLLALTINYSLQEEHPPYRNIMYYGDWSIYSGQKHFYPSQMNPKLISHLIFSSLKVDSNGDLILSDEFADFQTVGLPELKGIKYKAPYAGVLGAIAMLKVKNPHLKVGVSIGGSSENFSEVASEQEKRENFANNAFQFIRFVGYDFIDIDWEYPTSTGNSEDTENFNLLLQEIKTLLDKEGGSNAKPLELSVAMSSSPSMMSKIEYDKVLEIVDFAHMMTYDLNGGWNSYTAHQAPLYTNEAYNYNTMFDAQYSIDSCIRYLEETYGNTIDMKKIVIGVAPYTRGWSGVQNDYRDKDNPGLYATATRNSVKGVDGTYSGIYGFDEIPSLIKQYDLIEFFDNTAKAAYYYSPTNGFFFTCDNEESVAAKGKYVKEKGLGGLIAWMASYDPQNVITKAMYDSLYEEGYSFPEQSNRYFCPSISATPTITETGYTIRVRNNAALDQTNLALKDAEIFMKYLLNIKIYIKTKSGSVFSAVDARSGTITNENGEAIIDLSSVSDVQTLPPSTPYSFNVKVSGVIDPNDIETIYVSQRILPDFPEFKKRIVLDHR